MTERARGTANTTSRRQFLKQTSIGGRGLAAFARLPQVHASTRNRHGDQIGLIGCGGRGTGAVLDALGVPPKSSIRRPDITRRK